MRKNNNDERFKSKNMNYKMFLKKVLSIVMTPHTKIIEVKFMIHTKYHFSKKVNLQPLIFMLKGKNIDIENLG